MNHNYVLLLSLLAGSVAAGFVWFLWDLAEKLRDVAQRRRARTVLAADAAMLLEQGQAQAGQQEQG